MPFHFRERPNSRSGDDESQVRHYVASGSVDEVGIRLTAYSLTPSAIYNGKGFLYRQNVTTDVFSDLITYVEVSYGKQQKEEGTWTWDFDDTGGSVNIKVSKESVERFPGTAKDQKQLIGVNGDEVDGADIVIPTAKISVGFSHPQGVFSLSYAFAVSELTGTYNNATMLTRPAGEILFTGLRGSDGSQSPAQVTYNFAHSKNLQGLTVGAIEDVEKLGWHVAWVAYKPNDDDDKPGQEPEAVYIERVYDAADHATLLGFGG